MPRHKPPPKRAGRRASGHVFLLSVVRQNCAGFHASHDACEDNPTLGGGEQTLVIACANFASALAWHSALVSIRPRLSGLLRVAELPPSCLCDIDQPADPFSCMRWWRAKLVGPAKLVYEYMA